MDRLIGACFVFLAAVGCATAVRHPEPASPTASAWRMSAHPLTGACQDLPRPFIRATAAAGSRAVAVGPKDVRGRVLLPNGDDASGLIVNVGEQQVPTGGDGGFVLRKVPARYVLIIADPDRRRVTAYDGLTRRDPVVFHTAHDTSKVKGRCSQASISGRLEWQAHAAEVAAAAPTVYFMSATAFAKAEGAKPHRAGGNYGPLRVDWLGDSGMNGTLLAVYGGRTHSYVASASLALENGRAHQHDLRLTAVPMGRIAGSLGERSSYPRPQNVRVAYAPAGTAERIDLGECEVSDNGSFECLAPDLSAIDGEYCVLQSLGATSANRCGAKLGTTDFAVAPAYWEVSLNASGYELAPMDLASASREALASGMASWHEKGRRIYQLDIGSCAAGTCAVVYLERTTFTWGDFGALDLRYHPLVEKTVVISAIHPYATTDQLAAGGDPLGIRAAWHRMGNINLGQALPPRSEDEVSSRPMMLDWAETKGLPTCSSIREAIDIGNLGVALLETRVTVRGILTAKPGVSDDRAASNGEMCWGEWILDDPAQRFGSIRFFRSALQAKGGHCGEPRPPRVDAVVTGVLVPCGQLGPCGAGHPRCVSEFCLDEVSLCAVRP